MTTGLHSRLEATSSTSRPSPRFPSMQVLELIITMVLQSGLSRQSCPLPVPCSSIQLSIGLMLQMLPCGHLLLTMLFVFTTSCLTLPLVSAPMTSLPKPDGLSPTFRTSMCGAAQSMCWTRQSQMERSFLGGARDPAVRCMWA